MTLTVALIRHGQIRRDGVQRLTGITNEPLGSEGIMMITNKKEAGVYPDVGLVYASGLERCQETAGLIYPSGIAVLVEDGFNAINYGDFEGRELSELKQDASFQEWQLTGITTACPNGESPECFSMRVRTSFKKACGAAVSSGRTGLAIVSHRTVINEILRRYYSPRSNYTDWSVAPACGYLLLCDTETFAMQIAGIF